MVYIYIQIQVLGYFCKLPFKNILDYILIFGCVFSSIIFNFSLMTKNIKIPLINYFYFVHMTLMKFKKMIWKNIFHFDYVLIFDCGSIFSFLIFEFNYQTEKVFIKLIILDLVGLSLIKSENNNVNIFSLLIEFLFILEIDIIKLYYLL